jgi:hypothetical protein
MRVFFDAAETIDVRNLYAFFGQPRRLLGRYSAGFAIGSVFSRLARENQGRAFGLLAGGHLIVLTEEGELALELRRLAVQSETR